MRPDRIITTDGVVASMPHALWEENKSRIAELETENKSLLQSILTMSENGNGLAQSIVEAYARQGRDLFAERRDAAFNQSRG